MHPLLFQQQQAWDTSESSARKLFTGYARGAGLDVEQFNTCLDQGIHRAEVQGDIAEGRRLGTTGTPTFVINGKQLVGAQSFTAFANAINYELEQLEQ